MVKIINKKDRGKKSEMTILEMLILVALTVMFAIPAASSGSANDSISAVWVTDPHCLVSNSCKDFTNAFARADTLNLKLGLITGDVSDRAGGLAALKYAVSICEDSKIYKCYYDIGNHEFDSMTKKEWIAGTGMPSDNYFIDTEWGRFIFLDTVSDLSADEVKQLKEMLGTSQRVAVFCHEPISGTDLDADNAPAIRKILEDSGNVVIVFSGHIHKNTAIKISGIWYVTQDASKYGAFAAVYFENAIIRIIGYGPAVNRNFAIPTPVPTPSPSPSLSPMPTPIPSSSPMPMPTFAPIVAPNATETPSLTPMPVPTNDSTPDATPIITPTANATPEPTLIATPVPTFAPAPVETNLVLNSDLEIGTIAPLNWTFVIQNGNTPTWDNMSHSGSRSIKISIPGTSNVMSGYPQSDLIDANPLTVYMASVWGKTQNTGGSNTPAVRVAELDANRNFIRQNNIVPVFGRGANDWTQRTIEFKTDVKTKYLYVYANIWNGYGDFWMDDAVIRPKEISAPAAISTNNLTSTQTPVLDAMAAPTETLTVIP